MRRIVFNEDGNLSDGNLAGACTAVPLLARQLPIETLPLPVFGYTLILKSEIFRPYPLSGMFLSLYSFPVDVHFISSIHFPVRRHWVGERISNLDIK